MEAVSSIHNPRPCHAVVTGTHVNMMVINLQTQKLTKTKHGIHILNQGMAQMAHDRKEPHILSTLKTPPQSTIDKFIMNKKKNYFTQATW
jgi:altronate dehydratase